MSERIRLGFASIALVASVTSAGCYDVPGLATGHDGGTTGRDGSPMTLDGGGDAPVVDTGGGGEDGSAPPDGGCSGILCPCANGGDCPSGVCAQSITVGAALFGAAGGNNFCTQGCCTSADCPAGTVCFASGQGGQYCVNPAWLGRSAPGANALGGATCSTGTDCRSGLCSGSRCADTCCSLASSSTECDDGAVCVFGTFPGQSSIDTHFAPSCSAGGPGTYGADCSGNGDCQGGLCYQTNMGAYCTNPCRSQAECGDGSACQVDQEGNDVYAACFPWPATGGQGAACTSDEMCQGDWCGTSSQCTSICFTNADCTVVGWTCTPQPSTLPTGDYLLLACGP